MVQEKYILNIWHSLIDVFFAADIICLHFPLIQEKTLHHLEEKWKYPK
jgi:hypothetical protein